MYVLKRNILERSDPEWEEYTQMALVFMKSILLTYNSISIFLLSQAHAPQSNTTSEEQIMPAV